MSKYSRAVMTTGVSVFSHKNQFRKWLEEEQLLGWEGAADNPRPCENKSEEDVLEAIKTANLPPVSNPEHVSAEYSALSHLHKEDRLANQPSVVLVHTETFGGALAAVLDARLLERDFGASVDRRSVSFDLQDRSKFRYGLGTFMHVVASALREGEPNTTCFLPLGGYKVMTSLGYVAGAFCGYPTLYIQEETQVLHEVPAVPLRLARSDVEKIAPLLKEVNSGYEQAKLSAEERALLGEYPWLFERAEDLVSVNAFGVFVMQDPGFADLFATAILVSDQVQDLLEGSHKSFVLQQLRSLASKMAAGSTEQDLQHEKQWNLKSDRGQHLYKGASRGNLPFRCLYRFEEGTLRVEHVWTDHAAYERQAASMWGKEVATPHRLSKDQVTP